jgi:hypothetical protein
MLPSSGSPARAVGQAPYNLSVSVLFGNWLPVPLQICRDESRSPSRFKVARQSSPFSTCHATRNSFTQFSSIELGVGVKLVIATLSSNGQSEQMGHKRIKFFLN